MRSPFSPGLVRLATPIDIGLSLKIGVKWQIPCALEIVLPVHEEQALVGRGGAGSAWPNLCSPTPRSHHRWCKVIAVATLSPSRPQSLLRWWRFFLSK